MRKAVPADRGDLEGALRELDGALKFAAEVGEVSAPMNMQAKAEVLLALGRVDEGEAWLLKAATSNDNAPMIALSGAVAYYGLLAEQGRAAEARETLAAACEAMAPDVDNELLTAARALLRVEFQPRGRSGHSPSNRRAAGGQPAQQSRAADRYGW